MCKELNLNPASMQIIVFIIESAYCQAIWPSKILARSLNAHSPFAKIRAPILRSDQWGCNFN